MTERTDEALAARLREALSAVPDPFAKTDIVSSGRVESVLAADGAVQVALLAKREERAAIEALGKRIEAVASGVAGAARVSVVLTSHRTQAAATATATAKGNRPKLLGEVGKVIAVASGKGGVGKSTVAVNLAVGLARLGLRVGLLDADIHGPSLPTMLGMAGKPAIEGDRMIPREAWGVTCMSMGFLVGEGQAMVWRGPMVMGALEQLMGQVAWPALDVMVVDMPPGTGDVQLTMAQRVDLAGVVIVSTPQDIALIDARRGIDMFGRTGVPILGLVENMSVFCCPNCGHRTAIFGEGGVEREAAERGVEVLGKVPLLAAIRSAADSGNPADGEAGAEFGSIAARIREKLNL